MPMMPFIGVRISWLMLARNWLLAWLAASAASRACARLSASSRMSVMSVRSVTIRPSSVRLSTTRIQRPLMCDSRMPPWRFHASRSRIHSSLGASCEASSTPLSYTAFSTSSNCMPGLSCWPASPYMLAKRWFHTSRRSCASYIAKPESSAAIARSSWLRASVRNCSLAASSSADDSSMLRLRRSRSRSNCQ